ncbi:putative endonuclease [Clostridium acetobutylicum]|uniref:UPF0102 protein CA_C1763 n=1 Tax=Clostridium acetobutylicum (strain ATCC 824 / DSM 792 / JCM 1419 / IAM 19013 / LMG 5710 / NBRC 13948 / NRRL B-527 / VKM B-1787 / 2291 / W) TaxID=272562 RepID=Y1763_CLOAB|nr:MULTISPECIES: YraN family protein [Clostridium]Q97I89.1 RecName: Full=UPF0102 protein CA_C1763 [Clostridium acetobutylicum ATCC 824]AAK79729.1 Predicted endonuclease [Clostridium acetobutylicum ATCC 824]ADZ20813.1 Conserved hypothetical protein [Clostridium acetobutylicum EA 2018]AEI33879.1 hypothetical protein SMB_G1788 [Clostridium acetobutylicum DSM 1731]AWV79836.1 YraN family protein [Clostridium acetobutylicum]MBC2394180.1 YraN family protein [Clostridium acetobutylicum]
MHRLNKKAGDYGEKAAEIYLKKSGYTILNRNFRCFLGEVDIIAKNKDYITFVEVKSRWSDTYGLPCEAVNYRKKLKIYRTAKYYIASKSLINYNFRFDVIEVILNHQNDSYDLKFIENAFQI